MGNVSAITQLNIDVLYADIPSPVRPGEEVLAGQFSLQLGGGPQAVILTLAHLGVPTKLGLFYGDDIQSRLGLMMLSEFGYRDYQNLYRKSGHPSVVTSIMSYPEDRAFLAYNELAYSRDLSEDELYGFFSGADICFAPDNEAVLKKLRGEGVRMVFDIGWDEALRFDEYRHMLPYVEVFTPNDKEAMLITGTQDALAALESLARDVACPVIKTGKDGCIAMLDGKPVEIPAVDGFTRVDTTGAGDAFLAGIIFGMYQGWEMIDCIRMGNVLGGNAVTALGCLAARKTREQAMRLFERHFGPRNISR